MFNIGIGELVFVALLALIILGPERLPPLMRQLGEYAHDLRATLNQFNKQFAEELKPIQEIRSLVDDLNPARQLGNAMDVMQVQPTIAPPSAPAKVMAAAAATAALPTAAFPSPSNPMAQLRDYMAAQTAAPAVAPAAVGSPTDQPSGEVDAPAPALPSDSGM